MSAQLVPATAVIRMSLRILGAGRHCTAALLAHVFLIAEKSDLTAAQLIVCLSQVQSLLFDA